MRLYGEANHLPGLATGPIETRFARLRRHATADGLVMWTTPGRWAEGEGLSLRLPALQLEFACSLGDGHLAATKVAQVPEDARDPEREAGAVGVQIHVDHIALPPADVDVSEPDPGVAVLEDHFARLAGRRWGGFVEPLRAALEAEAEDDEERTRRLTVRYSGASIVRGGDEDVWKLSGVTPEALRAYDDGEWLEVLDPQGRSMTTARVIHPRAGEGTLEVGVRSNADPPKAGFVRPRSRRKILDQKRAVLEELASPTGSLPHLVRLVAAPASITPPRPVRPAHFVNAAVLRNRSQGRAVSLALGLDEGQALLIQGPPGTGKSTTAAEIDVQLIRRDPAVRILVCSHSNHGTDNMLMKVLPFLDDAADRIARIGFYDRLAKEARPFYAPPDADLGDRNVVFTTIDALALQDIAGGQLYDYVILDEANRAGVLDSLLALARGRRMILVGDAMQLQPVMSEAEQQIVGAANGQGGRRGRESVAMAPRPGPHNVIGKSLFAWLLERRVNPAATVLLDQQNRMHPAIGELVSRVFYSGKVRTGPAAPRRGSGLPAFPSPVTWVDTRSLRGNQESRAGGTSLFNVAEGRLVTSITRHILAQAPPTLTVGVIAAYAEQRDLLRRLLGPRAQVPRAQERQLETDTVDAFEGREKDIIVLSLVRANRRRDVGFLRLEQRLNVAVSRARRLIVVVGDTSTLRGGYFNQLIPIAGQVGQIVPAARLLAQLGGRAGKLRRDRDRDRVSRRERRERGQTQALEAPRGPADGAPAEERAGGEAPVTMPLPGEGRTRRRRRAWERRRERLRLRAQGAPAAVEEPHVPGTDAGTAANGAVDALALGGLFSPDDEPPPYATPPDDLPPERRPRDLAAARTARRVGRRRAAVGAAPDTAPATGLGAGSAEGMVPETGRLPATPAPTAEQANGTNANAERPVEATPRKRRTARRPTHEEPSSW